jgi:hypothetical protein
VFELRHLVDDQEFNVLLVHVNGVVVALTFATGIAVSCAE